jgi:hypothetical protein
MSKDHFLSNREGYAVWSQIRAARFHHFLVRCNRQAYKTPSVA